MEGGNREERGTERRMGGGDGGSIVRGVMERDTLSRM